LNKISLDKAKCIIIAPGLTNTTLAPKIIKDGVKVKSLQLSQKLLQRNYEENSSNGKKVMLISRTDLLTEKKVYC